MATRCDDVVATGAARVGHGHQKPNLPLLMTEGNGFDGDASRGSQGSNALSNPFSNPGVGTPSNASRSASRPMSPAGGEEE